MRQWLNLVKSMWKEAEMVRNKSVPTMEEYMENGYVSFALGPIVLPTLYFIGPKLSEEIITSYEYHSLFKLMSTCGRLLNDFQGFQASKSSHMFFAAPDLVGAELVLFSTAFTEEVLP